MFVCHSSKDKAFADQLVEGIENQGIDCWIAPRNITPGKKWAGEIMLALEECKALVFILSHDSNESDQVLTELETAKDRRIPIIPVLIDRVDLSYDVKYFIRSHQWIDAVDVALDQVVAKILSSLEGTVELPGEPPSGEKPATPKGSSEAPKPKKQTTPRPKQQPASGEKKQGSGISIDELLDEDGKKHCRFLVHDRVIESLEDIPVIKALDGQECRLIIVAENFEGAAAEVLKGVDYQGLSVLGLRVPGFGDSRKAVLEDIAICTGGVVITEEMGHQLAYVNLADLGTSADIRVNHEVKADPTSPFQYYWTSEFNTIVGGKARPETLKEHLEALKRRAKETSSDYDREKLQIRLASFQNIKMSPYLGQPDVSDYLFNYKE